MKQINYKDLQEGEWYLRYTQETLDFHESIFIFKYNGEMKNHGIIYVNFDNYYIERNARGKSHVENLAESVYFILTNEEIVLEYVDEI